MIIMSTKKEAERSTTTQSEDDKTKEVRTALSEQRHSVDRALDETKDNIKRTIEEARREIPRNTQAMIIKNIPSKQLEKLRIVT
jgi:gas vesicle protein